MKTEIHPLCKRVLEIVLNLQDYKPGGNIVCPSVYHFPMSYITCLR